jgi:hypothetical protein
VIIFTQKSIDTVKTGYQLRRRKEWKTEEGALQECGIRKLGNYWYKEIRTGEKWKC